MWKNVKRFSLVDTDSGSDQYGPPPPIFFFNYQFREKHFYKMYFVSIFSKCKFTHNSLIKEKIANKAKLTNCMAKCTLTVLVYRKWPLPPSSSDV